ncbi:LOW QUALITY PROTEIN: hypothetical protein MXB_4560 [Myxobolus squamalis]|nr:LOW QUALITY PROTEIN: hypothetical protein MXB_4560 [Myxobolus squamalis]
MSHPESPKYTYNITRNSEKTETIFKKLRGPFYDQNEVENLKVIKFFLIKSIDLQSEIKQMTVIEFMKNKKFRLAIFSLIMLNLGQQLCGINATPFVQNFKRKLLWLIGFGSMFISFSSYIIGQNFSAPDKLQIFWLCLFVFMFQIGPGPVCWFISVEMFPPDANGAAQGVAGFFNYVANTLVFLIFPIALLVIFIYSCFFVVETFKKSQKDVMEEYQNISLNFCKRTLTESKNN